MATVNEDIINKVREHKHAYAERFGYVVTAPAEELLNSMLSMATSEDKSQRDIFSPEQRREIISTYKKAIKCQAIYEQLGLPFKDQIARLKGNVIPDIHALQSCFQSYLNNPALYETYRDNTSSLLPILKMAVEYSSDILDKLGNIEHFDYGESKVFDIRKEIRDAFREDNNSHAIAGDSPIAMDYHTSSTCGSFKVLMNQEHFKSHFLGNIIKNFHDHAFPNQYSADKKIKVSFSADKSQPSMLAICIENNGTPFEGDINTVFDRGIGKGTGIGLYSARQFISFYGGFIDMYKPSDNDYSIGFKIIVPTI